MLKINQTNSERNMCLFLRMMLLQTVFFYFFSTTGGKEEGQGPLPGCTQGNYLATQQKGTTT
jgi:hypothetical protein